jgi:hypothetical protein
VLVHLLLAVAGARPEAHESPSHSAGYLYTAGDSLSRQASSRRTREVSRVLYMQGHVLLTLTFLRRQSRHPDRDFFNICPSLFTEADIIMMRV